MKNTKKGTAAALIAGGILAAGAGAASAHGGASASGEAAGSPGVASGNLDQVPVHVPVNAAGNAVTAIGLLNGAWGDTAAHG
ncbi:chaplin [Streptomyces globosus]|uniref:chaplin n=1 Tax=Streptomyces globosus TaxID=68209 RepID=UPI0031D2B2DF